MNWELAIYNFFTLGISALVAVMLLALICGPPVLLLYTACKQNKTSWYFAAGLAWCIIIVIVWFAISAAMHDVKIQ